MSDERYEIDTGDEPDDEDESEEEYELIEWVDVDGERRPAYWYKRKKTDKVWWKHTPGVRGIWIFSFDKKKEYYFYRDYPHALTDEEFEIFIKENPILGRNFGGKKRLKQDNTP